MWTVHEWAAEHGVRAGGKKGTAKKKNPGSLAFFFLSATLDDDDDEAADADADADADAVGVLVAALRVLLSFAAMRQEREGGREGRGRACMTSGDRS